MLVRLQLHLRHRRLRALALFGAVFWLGACSAQQIKVPLRPFYLPADPFLGRVELDVPYRDDAQADAEKHRLDLFLPEGEGWPMLLFVHGGSLEKGDTSQRVVGHDIYRNIGRYYAARGVAVALVNYRLQPDVHWKEQVDDVARATDFVERQLERLGGDGRLYLSGHSAGAWLVSRVALNHELWMEYGWHDDTVDGVISISGSGYDLTDELTWKWFGREKRWARRFSLVPGERSWKERASVVPLIHKGAPPFLLLHSKREHRALVRQNTLFCDALRESDVVCDREEIPGHGHRRMLLAISHDRRPVAGKILAELGDDE